MRHRIGLAALLLVGCTGEPPTFPTVPGECAALAATVAHFVAVSGADAGLSRDDRNAAVDRLAACLKGLP